MKPQAQSAKLKKSPRFQASRQVAEPWTAGGHAKRRAVVACIGRGRGGGAPCSAPARRHFGRRSKVTTVDATAFGGWTRVGTPETLLQAGPRRRGASLPAALQDAGACAFGVRQPSGAFGGEVAPCPPLPPGGKSGGGPPHSTVSSRLTAARRPPTSPAGAPRIPARRRPRPRRHPAALAGAFDDDAPHRLGRRGEELAPARPRRVFAGQPQPRLMHQRRGLEGVVGGLLRHLRRRQLAKFLVNQREQLVGGPGITRVQIAEELGDVGHGLDDGPCPPSTSRRGGTAGLATGHGRDSLHRVHHEQADEWQEWFRLEPLERWRESMKLWTQYLAQGGNLDPEPDSQSPFDFPELRGARPVDGRAGLRVLRRGGV